VQRLASQRELTVIVVLHDVDLASRFCDRLVALKAGQVVADGTPAERMDSPVLESIYSVPMGVMERAPGHWVSYVHYPQCYHASRAAHVIANRWYGPVMASRRRNAFSRLTHS